MQFSELNINKYLFINIKKYLKVKLSHSKYWKLLDILLFYNFCFASIVHIIL